jgi:glycosyltransferase involved in cell wall biosynthesis
METTNKKNSIVFLTSYPPVECGIASYSNDLYKDLHKILPKDFNVKICAVENNDYKVEYPEEVYRVLDSTCLNNYIELAKSLNNDESVSAVFIQHEFGLYGGKSGEYILYFLKLLKKPVFITLHTVLPEPDHFMQILVEEICNFSSGISVMTNNASCILSEVYKADEGKIFVIPHGTHPVDHINKDLMKKKHDLDDRFVLTTFGLLSRNKSIETMLDAMIPVVKQFPEVMYLVLGKTHPGVVKFEGESYREELMRKVKDNKLNANVRFINKFFSLQELLEYLKSTDIYLFTSKDKHQAVSGTLSYAMGSGLPVFSTPIPQAKEVLGNSGLFYDFENSKQLSELLLYVLKNPDVRDEMSENSIMRANWHTWKKVSKMHLSMIFKTLYKNQKIYPGKEIAA